jgi:hypothetical protein
MLILFSLFIIQYFPYLQKNIYGEENDLCFPVSAAYIYPLALTCAFMLVYDLILQLVLLRIPKIRKNLIIYEEKSASETEKIYLEKMERRYFTFEFILLFIFIFCSVMTFPVHLRINDEGIFYTKIFTFKEKYYKWDELESASVSYIEQDSRLEMELEFGGHKISIAGSKSLIPPDTREVFLAIDLIKQNANIIIKMENQ